MPDYSLGRAHGEIQIDYDGRGADQAERDLGSVAAASDKADKSLTKTQKSLSDTETQFTATADSAEGYQQRLRDVETASRDVQSAEDQLRNTLLDTKATLDDIKDAEDRVGDARKRHVQATNASRDAHKALSDEMGIGQRALRAFSDLIPNLHSNLERITTRTGAAGEATTGLASKLGDLTKVVALFGPQGRAAAAGLTLLADGMDKTGSSAGALGGFAKNVAEFEVAFGKISGLTLAVPSIGGLAGLGGAAGVQGLVEVASAGRQLSGVLGLLPAVVSAVGFSMGTLQVATRGVGDALSDMMSDDPKKFLEDLKNMGPVAAQAMLQVAGFRDEIKMAGAAVQDSFFTEFANSIAPLIQKWLPAVTSGMSQVAGVFGEFAEEFAQVLMQPGPMQAFQDFIGNVSAGLTAMQPVLPQLLSIFMQLTSVGSSFFEQIGGNITQILGVITNKVNEATSSGKLGDWIQAAITGFNHVIDIVYNVGSAFGEIMNIADKFGGGGLLAWLDDIAIALNNWTQSADGQKALTDFFAVVRQATDEFTPMLKPLVEGLASIATAFTQLGVATAPGWQTVFDTFASTMEQLGPQIVALAPALNTFLEGLAGAFAALMAQLGPQLPKIFQDLADAFVALLPQIGPLVDAFLSLVQQVGPMLPTFFNSVTGALQALERYWPIAVGFIRNFVSVVNGIVEVVTGALHGFESFVEGAADGISRVWDVIEDAFVNFPKNAEEWGKKMIDGLIKGILSGLNFVGDAAKRVADEIASWFPQSPAKQGPFSGAGYTYVRGQKMISDMAAGMTAAQPAVEAAAASTASAASAALGAGTAGGAPSPGGRSTTGNALLPDHIASADTSILTAYLRHQFSDSHGLKGLAKDLGEMLDVAQSGFNLINQHAIQPLFQALGMVPGMNAQTWRKLSPEEIAAQQQSDLQKKALQGDKGPTWDDVFGPGGGGAGGSAATPFSQGVGVPLGVTADSSKSDIQKAIIAAGRARGMNDSAIQTALAVAAAESSFNPTVSGGVQGSAGLVSGLYQQSPSSGWGTLDQVNDPTHAINAFYDAFAKQLAQNPTNPQLAAVLTQNPQLGSGAQGSEYWDAVSNQQGLASSIMTAYAKGVTGPSWQQLTGSTAPPPAAQGSGTYGLPTNTDTGGYGTGNADTFPPWVMALAERFNVAPSTYAGHQASDRGGEAGYAPNPDRENRGIDWSGSVKDMQAFADFLAKAAPGLPGLEQIIWENPNTGQRIGLGGAGNPTTGYYPDTGEGSYAEHQNHVHTRQSAPIVVPSNTRVLAGTGTPITAAEAAMLPDDRRAAIDQAADIAAGRTSGAVGDPTKSPFYKPDDLTLPSGQSLDALTDTATKNTSINDQLLQAYLQGNPALAQQINAAQVPGASDTTVTDALTGIGTTIDGLKAQDAVGNKNTIAALQSQQSAIAGQQGFASGPSALSQAQSLAGGISGAVSGVFQSIQSGLEALTATQDIADRLVYGVRNTEDISKIVDDVQKYIKYAADIISTAGAIVSTVGSFTGGSDFGGTSAAGSALSLISSVLQGVNAAIDFGQQVYEITMGYVGKFMSVLTGLGGTNLMGNVGFLLNKNTGELLSYSRDNPEAKNAAKAPSWMNSWYDYNGGGNPNPQVNQQLNVYAGPGQSPAAMMNETMWMVNTSGTTGAMAPSNF